MNALTVGTNLQGTSFGARWSGVITEVIETNVIGTFNYKVQLDAPIRQPHYNGYGFFTLKSLFLYSGGSNFYGGNNYKQVPPLDYAI